MKGGPPVLSYLCDLLEMFQARGVSGVVVEWEDMMDWSGGLSVLARPGHYTRHMITQLLDTADKLGLVIIPLIQTFGHMEFVLKHEEFKHLRDIAEYPNCVKPLCVDTEEGGVRRLLSEMIEQVVWCHPGVKMIHVGCDEVWTLGQSAEVREHCEKTNLSITDIFLQHMTQVARMVRERVVGVEVLVWDDMMRTAPVDTMLRYSVGQLVQPVIWNYGSVLEFPSGMLERYLSVWPESGLWAGTAWRGATGSDQCLTPAQHHVDNHLAWLHLADDHVPGLAGFILTGWSRYDHYAALCELLPVSLPSLMCCLSVLSTGHWTPADLTAVSSHLELSESLIMSPAAQSDTVQCPQYPGSTVYSWMMKYSRLSSLLHSIMTSSHRSTWLNSWQLQTGFINPLQAQTLLRQLSLIHKDLGEVQTGLGSEISKYLHDFTADEWIKTNITSKMEEIEKILTPAMRAFTPTQ